MEKEQKATVAAGTGATASVAGAVGTVAALGVRGLGATGITSGLAAVGSVVGGGMAAGLFLSVAAPVAGAAAAYCLYKWLKD